MLDTKEGYVKERDVHTTQKCVFASKTVLPTLTASAAAAFSVAGSEMTTALSSLSSCISLIERSREGRKGT